MSAHAGDRANETGRFACEKCGRGVHVDKGQEIPTCPSCGNSSYGSRSREPGRDVTRSR